MGIQAHVPAALCALHNFIQHFDADTFNDLEFDWDYVWFNENEGLPLDAEDVEEVVLQEWDKMGRVGEQRDMIARTMWEDYLGELARRGHGPPT